MITNGHVHHDAKPPSSYHQSMQILRRNSGSTFEEIELPQSSDYFADTHVGRALLTLDANHDGRIDLAVTHQTEPLALLMNQTDTNHSWIRLRLVGRQVSRGAIGSTVTVRFGATTRMAPLVSGDGFYCANERVLHFGLGGLEDGSTVRIQIRWPDGTLQETTALSNSSYIVVQGERAFAYDAPTNDPPTRHPMR